MNKVTWLCFQLLLLCGFVKVFVGNMSLYSDLPGLMAIILCIYFWLKTSIIERKNKMMHIHVTKRSNTFVDTLEKHLTLFKVLHTNIVNFKLSLN